MKYLGILFTIALVGLASCAQYSSNYPWGAEKDGIKTRLTPLKKTYTLGEPIMFRLELTNVDTAPISYHTYDVDRNDVLLVKDLTADLIKYRLIKYYDTYYQVSVGNKQPVIMPNEIVCLFSDFDITMHYHICKPGKYTVQFKGNDASVPPSNVAEIEIKDGKFNDFDSIRCKLLHSMPEDWRMYKTSEFGVNDELIRLREQGLIVEKYFIMLLPPQKGIVENILVWHTKTPMDISTIKEPKRPYSQPVPIPGYLGQDQWGYAYWEYTPQAVKLWPRAKEDIIKALGVKNEQSAQEICDDSAIEVAKKAGYDYVDVVKGCLVKNNESMHTLFWLTEHAGFDAASSEGNSGVLGALLNQLGDDFFGSCLTKESKEIQGTVRSMLLYDFGYTDYDSVETNAELKKLHEKYPKTFPR